MPDGFRFAVKLPLTRLDRVTPFLERAHALGDRLGPIRVVVEAARDDGLVSFVTGLDAAGRSSSRGTSGTSRGTASTGVVRGRRLRAPSRSATSGCASRRTRDDDLRELAATLRDPAYVYIRHEDEPTAPETARASAGR